VQAVIVTRLLRTLDFLLQTQDGGCIGYREWSHDLQENTFRLHAQLLMTLCFRSEGVC